METYFAPPDRFDLVLNSGDTLDVDDDGHAYNTTINSGGVLNVNDRGGAFETTIAGGVENVYAGAFDLDTTINFGGVLNVHGGGVGETTINFGGDETIYGGTAYFTTINSGGRVIVDGGTAYFTTIHGGGAELVYAGKADDTTINSGGMDSVFGGTANNTTINSGGVEYVYDGTADGVTFGGPQAKLGLVDTPSSLIGTIRNWHVGDVIDFLKNAPTSVQENAAHTTLTVTYGFNETASYSLAGQQANTEFKLRSDGQGGTELILIGVPSPHPLIAHPFV
jgi:autotransporter passenger strand-loop-strand repeat protein